MDLPSYLKRLRRNMVASDLPELCGNCYFGMVVRQRGGDGSPTKLGGYCNCAYGQGRKAAESSRAREELRSQAHNLIGRAGIPSRYAAANLHHFEGDSVQAETARRALAAVNLDEGQGVIIWGEVGVGKTYLATAILTELILRGYGGLFVALPDLLDRIRATYSGIRDAYSVIDRTQEVQVLLLDDIGTESDTRWVREKVYQIVNARYNARKTIIATSNIDIPALAESIGDRVVSRLVEMCQPLRLVGHDRRIIGSTESNPQLHPR